METPTGSELYELLNLEPRQWTKDNIAVYPMVHFNHYDQRTSYNSAREAYEAARDDGKFLVIFYPEWIVNRRDIQLEDIPDHDLRLLQCIPYSINPVKFAHGVVVIGEKTTKVMKNFLSDGRDSGYSDACLKTAVLEVLTEEGYFKNKD